MTHYRQPASSPRTTDIAHLTRLRQKGGRKKIEMTTETKELKPLRTKHLAAKFGMKATSLRRVLRAMPEYADGVHTNYKWAENDAMIKKIEAKIAELKKARAEAAEKAKKELAAKKEEEKKTSAITKKAA